MNQIIYANQGATRRQPLNADLVKAMGFLSDMGVTMEVFSGGQPSSGPDRVGSHRHDDGGAGDVFFYKDGRKLDWSNPADVPIFENIVRKAKAAGVTGFGAGEGYMQPGSVHLGFGNPAVWGKGGRGANAADWLRNAYNSPGEATQAFDPVRAGAVALDAAPSPITSFDAAQPQSAGQQAISSIIGTNRMNNRPVLANDDGSFSTEESITVTDPRLNGGKPTNIPSIWNGRRTADENEAIGEALRSGQAFQPFDSIDEAVKAARERSNELANGVPGGAQFDPVKAGAVPFDPVKAGAQPADEGNAPASDASNPDDSDLISRARVAAGGLLEGIPIAGPAIRAASEYGSAAIRVPFTDKSFNEELAAIQARREREKAANPMLDTGAQVVGAVGTMIPVGMTALGGTALGVAGNSLLGRTVASGLSSAAISGADTAARGGDMADVGRSALTGLGIGAALPGVGAGLNVLGRSVYDAVAPRLNALVRPAQEAQRRVGTAITRDAAAAPVLGQADEASAAINNQNLLNVDRGGETTRALARSVANQDPEARAIINNTASDRFASQGYRAQSFIDRITHGASDDMALKDALKEGARKANKPAYEKAYREGAELKMTPELQRLTGSPAVVAAMKKVASERGKDRAVAEGFGAFNPKVTITDDGRVMFKSVKPGAPPTYPDLQFWDYAKRELDDMANAAGRAGKKEEAATLQTLSRNLRTELDNQVPSYADARAGAAKFFGAEDALDAGKKFVTQNRTLAESEAAIKKMSVEERAAFAVGFAGELKDAIKQSGDRTNVINKIFGSEQAKEKIRIALGSKALGEFEQFVKVEHAMDMLRNAQGNSTTARQLVELGLAGTSGVGVGAYTGDWKSGLTTAVVVGLARRGGAKIDERITKSMAKLLLSNDPKALKQATVLASNSPKAAAALNAIQTAIASATRGMVTSGGRPANEITVTEARGKPD